MFWLTLKFLKMDIIIISIKGHNVSYLSVISLCFKSRKARW